MVGVVVGLVVGVAVYVGLNRAWQHTIQQTPVDPASPGDLEELVGNAGGIVVLLLAVATALVAAWILN